MNHVEVEERERKVSFNMSQSFQRPTLKPPQKIILPQWQKIINVLRLHLGCTKGAIDCLSVIIISF